MPKRSMLHIYGKQPFYDWANSPDNGEMAPDFDEGLVLMIPDELVEEEVTDYMKFQYIAIFEHFLFSMWTDDELWPDELSWELFEQWFDWRYCSIVYDTLSDSNSQDLFMDRDN